MLSRNDQECFSWCCLFYDETQCWCLCSAKPSLDLNASLVKIFPIGIVFRSYAEVKLNKYRLSVRSWIRTQSSFVHGFQGWGHVMDLLTLANKRWVCGKIQTSILLCLTMHDYVALYYVAFSIVYIPAVRNPVRPRTELILGHDPTVKSRRLQVYTTWVHWAIVVLWFYMFWSNGKGWGASLQQISLVSL